MPRPIALLTDFGCADAYAGVMKGVIHSRLPGAVLFDLTHGIPPQNIRAGALQLRAALPFCPPDTVVLAVVDPGVGSARRPVCLRAGERLLVGPDNGLLWPAASLYGVPQAWVLDRPEHWLPRVGGTFHGRDLFAPTAAALAAGIPPEAVGTPIPDPMELHFPQPERAGEGWTGEILLVDGYGNAVTSFGPEHLGDGPVRLRCGGLDFTGSATHYAAAAPGAPVLVLNSYNLLEIAVNGGSAAARFGLREGQRVTLHPGS